MDFAEQLAALAFSIAAGIVAGTVFGKMLR